MIFGYLANMVAIIPSWITMIVNQPDLDVAPVGGPTMKPERFETSAEFVRALDRRPTPPATPWPRRPRNTCRPGGS